MRPPKLPSPVAARVAPRVVVVPGVVGEAVVVVGGGARVAGGSALHAAWA